MSTPGAAPGRCSNELEVADNPEKKIDDFSMHQLPTSNLLRELKELCGVEVVVVSAQVGEIPDSVRPGLSEAVRAAVPGVAARGHA